MRIALAIQQNENEALEPKLQRAAQAGFAFVQPALWDMEQMTEAHAQHTKRLLQTHRLQVREVWCGWHGPAVWDFVAGPATLGIVPPEYRASRLQNLLQGARYAKILGADTVITHLGFLPVNPGDENYVGVVQALKYFLKSLQNDNLSFLLETGQETPAVALRLMEDVDMPNFGINFDPANLMMYGNANALDAAKQLCRFIRCVHAKDGEYPVCGHELGEEKPLGQGGVQFDAVMRLLLQGGFDGTVAVENERNSHPDVWFEEIVAAKATLERIAM